MPQVFITLEFMLSPAIYIDTKKSLARTVDTLLLEPLIGVDTESNSLHAYQERVCLIQISTRTQDYIIDPLKVKDLKPLGRVLASEKIEKVFHAAEYDLMCLKRDFGFDIVNLFDTMIAARICGYKQVGLNNLLSQHLNIQIDKSHQRDNWGERPLPAESLLYAQMDTHYLLRLRDILKEELARRGHLEEAEETFAEICEATPPHDGRIFDPDGFWKIGMPNGLNMGQMAVLRELYLLREEAAREFDVPPFRIFSNQLLVDIARVQPETLTELAEMRGMSPSNVRRYGRQIINAIYRGRAAQLDAPPQYRPPPQEISDRYIVLHAWRKQKAQDRGVESDVIISRQTLWDLAYKVPKSLDELEQIEGLGPWRRQQYGQELLSLLNNHR
jgi:ribonuclease D